MSLVAGQTNGTVDYYPTQDGVSYDPVLNGGSMTSQTVYDMDGTTVLATTTNDAKIADGHYRFTFATAIASPGNYPVTTVWEATASGPTVTDTSDTVRVEAFGGDVGGAVTVAMVKTALNKTLTVDDAEIQSMIDAALVEYFDWVGPSGTVVEKHDGGRSVIVLRSSNVASLSGAEYSDGTVIDVVDLDLDGATGIVGWGYNTAGSFTAGIRNVTITYTVAALPLNHREAIIADVAGYFEATQMEPSGPDDDGYALAQRSAPLVLFPRIRSLAGSGIA